MSGYDDATLVSQANAIDASRLTARHRKMVAHMTELVSSGGAMSDRQRGHLSAIIVRDEMAGPVGSHTRSNPLHRSKVNVSTTVLARNKRRRGVIGWCVSKVNTGALSGDPRSTRFVVSVAQQMRKAAKSGHKEWGPSDKQWAIIQKIKAKLVEAIRDTPQVP